MQYDDYDKTKFWTDGRHAGKKKYKSRKIADYNHQLQLMGFVRLHALSQKEVSERELALQKSHHDQQEQMLSVIKQREAELQKKQADEQARLLAIEQEKQKHTTDSFFRLNRIKTRNDGMRLLLI